MHSFSKDPVKAFDEATQKGYSRVRFQQGKPVLDRELNLLGDLANPQRMAQQYIGNGVPAGNDGFAITNLNVAGSDFTIGAGRCLINGTEVVLPANTTYKTQPHTDKVAAFPAGILNAYLRVFATEITDVEDADLQNAGDVGFVTAIREKADWEVLISVPAINQPDHYLLAIINPAANTITDRRRKELTTASIRDEVTGARGTTAKLGDRLDAAHDPTGALKPNAVAEPALATDSVSKRTIQNGAVSMAEMALTQVVDQTGVVVPAGTPATPGEVVVNLQTADEHAFFLTSVLQTAPRPQLAQPIGFTVSWMHRIVAGKGPGPANPYNHIHQIVIQNSTATAVTVSVRSFRVAAT